MIVRIVSWYDLKPRWARVFLSVPIFLLLLADLLWTIFKAVLPFIAALTALAGLILALAGVVNHDTHVSCLRLHEQTQLSTRVAGGLWSAECYVRLPSGWVPVSVWREVP